MARRIALLVPVLLAGCYHYTPLATPDPAPGTKVALVLSDQGRVGLGPSVGAGVKQVDGAVVASSDTAYVVSVSDVVNINGGRSPWAGETVHVQRAFVANSLERRFSRGRTLTFAGGTAVAFVAFILSRSLLGFGGGEASNLPPGGPLGNQ